MNIFSIKAKIIIITTLIIIGHVLLACLNKIENYEAFVCSLGYISLAVLIVTMIPDKDESRN